MKFAVYVIVSVPCVMMVMALLPVWLAGNLAWAIMKPLMDLTDNLKKWSGA